MSYDLAGNLTYDSSNGSQGDRAYDAENRMIAARGNFNAAWQYYVYDAEGKRVKRNLSDGETWQVYGIGGELIAEYAATNTSPSAPQKEYGYRNGQLLITTEAGTTSAAAPSALTASPPTSGASITLNWSSASGATNYRVERQGAGGSFTLVGTTSSTTLTDNTTTTGSTYLYKVCAANGAGSCTSGYSNIALGTAVTFPTDPIIKSYSEDPANATSPKAAHITELRTAVNAVRSLASLAAVTTPNPAAGDVIGVNNVRDLRTKLGDALTALGIQLPNYTDATLKGFSEDPLNATPIKAAHIRELRQAATNGIGGSGGGGGSSFQIHWLVSDQLGTPRMIFDQSGNLSTTSRHDYLPFGEELGAGVGGRTTAQGYSVSDGVRQRFSQKERDGETGLDWFNSRYYSSNQGRFVTSDIPFADQRIENPQSWNLYTYCRNSPLNYVDPDGRSTHTDKDGNVVAVYDDRDVGVYEHDDLKKWDQKSKLATKGKGVNYMGVTEYWDEFAKVDAKGRSLEAPAENARIDFRATWDDTFSSLARQSEGMWPWQVADASKNGHRFDIKSQSDLAPDGPYTGKRFQLLEYGTPLFVSARSLGNFLAGFNGATTQVLGFGIDEHMMMNLAGALQQKQFQGARTFYEITRGKEFGPAPYYGEEERSGRWIHRGFVRGVQRVRSEMNGP